tara:strand:+ start:439536 stop:440396 length:861 start_codon:yes stop_codon:yes gene_type:complete
MKHYVVTGVSSGIGLALARLLVKQGHHVFGSVRRQEDADRVSAELGETFTPLLMDLTDDDAITRAAQVVRGYLDGHTLAGLVNNAGIATHGPLLDMPFEDIEHQVDANLMGTLRVIRAFAPLLGLDASLSGAPGRIVNISAGTSTVIPPFLGSFAMVVCGIEGMSDALRRELLLVGIDVIIFAVGNTMTPLWDKADAENMEQYRNSIFFEALMRFRMHVIEYARQQGRTAESAAFLINKALTARRPRAKYLISSSMIGNQIWPRMLPRRVLDRVFGKTLGLLPKRD